MTPTWLMFVYLGIASFAPVLVSLRPGRWMSYYYGALLLWWVLGSVAVVRRLAPIARELGCTLAQLSIAWCVKNPHVSTVITGASRASQVVENFAAMDVVAKLDADVMARIDAAVK